LSRRFSRRRASQLPVRFVSVIGTSMLVYDEFTSAEQRPGGGYFPGCSDFAASCSAQRCSSVTGYRVAPAMYTARTCGLTCCRKCGTLMLRAFAASF